MKKKLFVLGLVMMCGMSVLTGCDESANTRTSINVEKMSPDELDEYFDGGDVGSDEWYQEHYGNN